MIVLSVNTGISLWDSGGPTFTFNNERSHEERSLYRLQSIKEALNFSNNPPLMHFFRQLSYTIDNKSFLRTNKSYYDADRVQEQNILVRLSD